MEENFLEEPAALEGRQTLSEKAYKLLEEMIVTSTLEPGSIVSEAALSKHIGIGRTPVREALQRLAYEGTITVLPRSGVMISEINITIQLKLLGVRRELERFLATCAAKNSTARAQQLFLQFAEQFEAAAELQDDLAFVRTDRSFDCLISDMAKNEYAKNAVAPLRALSRRFWYAYYHQVGNLPVMCRKHAAVARAIAARDESAAAVASDALMDYLEQFTRATITSTT